MYGSAAPAAAATEAAEASCTATAEDVAEHGEDIVHREASGSASEAIEAAKASTHVWTVEPELVILLALLVVGENGIGLGGLLELLFCLLLLRIALVALTVRVILYRDLAVCFLYVCGAGFLVYAKHLIVISFCHEPYLKLAN